MKSQPKANVYIDGANMFYAQQKMGWFIDWKQIKVWLETQYKVVDLKYYSGYKPNDKKMSEFFIKLKSYGYQLTTKKLKKIYSDYNSVQKYIYKANCDVEISVDMILERKRYDLAILFSGDSDFEYVVNTLKKFNKKIIVCGIEKGISSELRKVATAYTILTKIRQRIEFKK